MFQHESQFVMRLILFADVAAWTWYLIMGICMTVSWSRAHHFPRVAPLFASALILRALTQYAEAFSDAVAPIPSTVVAMHLIALVSIVASILAELVTKRRRSAAWRT